LIGKVHADLKSKIIAGLHRPGEMLRVDHLKRDYGVSGGTLREALTMLVADRLVIVEGQRGFKVMPLSAEDLIDLNNVRILLEKEAIRQSITHGDEEWEGKVVSTFHILSRATRAFSRNKNDQAIFDEWERRHRTFHMALFSAARSEWIRYFLTVSYQQYERYRHLFHALTRGIRKKRDIDTEHADIVDAVLARDADAAAMLLEQHLLRTSDEWVEFFKKTGAFASKRHDAVSPRSAKPAARQSRRVK
jgi:DNA-binding GntR family transcriptional regulator